MCLPSFHLGLSTWQRLSFLSDPRSQSSPTIRVVVKSYLCTVAQRELHHDVDGAPWSPARCRATFADVFLYYYSEAVYMPLTPGLLVIVLNPNPVLSLPVMANVIPRATKSAPRQLLLVIPALG